MTAPPRASILAPTVRVCRRLFLQRLGRAFTLVAPLLLVLASLALLAGGRFRLRGQPDLVDSPDLWLRLLVVVGPLVLGVVTLLVLHWLRRPTLNEAALALDDRFGLRQRVTTALGLGPVEEATPAGQALLADTVRRTADLDVAAAYPLTPSRRAWLLLPAVAAAVGAVLFADLPGAVDLDRRPVASELKAELEDVSRRLREMTPPKQPGGEKRPGGEEMEKILTELARLADQKPKTQGEARDLLKDLTSLEDRMRRLEQGLAQRAENHQKQAEEADRLARKKKPEKQPTPQEEGLKDGDFRSAADELRRLSREMQNGSLSPEQRDKLEKQMNDLKEQLDRLADQKRKQEPGEAGKLDPGQLEELKKMEAADLADLADILEDLAKAGDSLRDGKDGEAKQRLAAAAGKLGRLDPKGDQEAMAGRVALVQELKGKLGQGLGGAPAPASGKRPESKPEDLKGRDTQAKSERSKGGLSGFRFVPGAGLREPKSPEEMRTLIEDAGRENAEAVLRQRLSRGDADLTRGFYEKLRK